MLKKRRKEVCTHLSTAGPLKAALCVCWAGPMSDRAQSGYCFFEESNGILLQLLMEKIFDVFGREWMWRGEEEREARLTPCPISFRSLGGWDRASVVPSRQCLYTGCVRSVDGTDIPGISSSGPRKDGGIALLWVKLITVASSTMAFLACFLMCSWYHCS